jgi:hypothetical protein
MTDSYDPHYELSWNSNGVKITEYNLEASPEPSVEGEWWFTWVGVFTELTGVDGHAPDIV